MVQASAEKREHTEPAEKERMASVPQREQVASVSEPPLPKRKGTEPSVLSTRAQDREGDRESRWARAASWQEKGRSEQEHGEERVVFTVKEGRFQEGKGERARRVSLGEVEGSMSERVDAKALHVDLQSLGVTPCLAKSETEKEFGRQRACS